VENKLDRLARKAGLEDGFEGNAQSFRIVSKLGVSDTVTADSDKTPVIRGGISDFHPNCLYCPLGWN
jgi:dGTPase